MNLLSSEMYALQSLQSANIAAGMTKWETRDGTREGQGLGRNCD